MDDGALGGVFDGAAEDLMGQWGGIAFAQEDKPHQVDDGVNVGPVKVDVGNAFRRLFDLDEESGDGVGNGGAPGMEYTIGTIAGPLDSDCFGEL